MRDFFQMCALKVSLRILSMQNRTHAQLYSRVYMCERKKERKKGWMRKRDKKMMYVHVFFSNVLVKKNHNQMNIKPRLHILCLNSNMQAWKKSGTFWLCVHLSYENQPTQVIEKYRIHSPKSFLTLSTGLRRHQLYTLQKSKTPPPTHPEKHISSMTLNCNWRWGSSYGDLGNVEYPFISITPRFTLAWSGTCQGPI